MGHTAMHTLILYWWYTVLRLSVIVTSVNVFSRKVREPDISNLVVGCGREQSAVYYSTVWGDPAEGYLDQD